MQVQNAQIRAHRPKLGQKTESRPSQSPFSETAHEALTVACTPQPPPERQRQIIRKHEWKISLLPRDKRKPSTFRQQLHKRTSPTNRSRSFKHRCCTRENTASTISICSEPESLAVTNHCPSITMLCHDAPSALGSVTLGSVTLASVRLGSATHTWASKLLIASHTKAG